MSRGGLRGRGSEADREGLLGMGREGEREGRGKGKREERGGAAQIENGCWGWEGRGRQRGEAARQCGVCVLVLTLL